MKSELIPALVLLSFVSGASLVAAVTKSYEWWAMTAASLFFVVLICVLEALP